MVKSVVKWKDNEWVDVQGKAGARGERKGTSNWAGHEAGRRPSKQTEKRSIVTRKLGFHTTVKHLSFGQFNDQ